MQQQMMLSQHSCPLANTCNNDINMSSSSEEDKEEEDIIHTNAVERISLLPPLLILQQ